MFSENRPKQFESLRIYCKRRLIRISDVLVVKAVCSRKKAVNSRQRRGRKY